MRTPLTVATGLVLLAGVVVGVTTTAASADGIPAVQPIRVEAPPVPGAVADVETAVPVIPVVPAQPSDLQPADPQPAKPRSAPQQEAAPRDQNGYVAPPPADDDDDDAGDDDDGGAGDDDADD